MLTKCTNNTAKEKFLWHVKEHVNILKHIECEIHYIINKMRSTKAINLLNPCW